MNDSCLVSLGTGQLVFDILGQTEIHGVKNVTNSLSEALVQLGKQDKDVRLGVQGKYLVEGGGGGEKGTCLWYHIFSLFYIPCRYNIVFVKKYVLISYHFFSIIERIIAI